jgi:hypothetical protein
MSLNNNELFSIISIGKGSVMKIIEELSHYQVCVSWIPRLLVDVHKERRKPRLLIF